MNINKILLSLFFPLILCIFVIKPFEVSAGLKNTKHNLSASGPGPVISLREKEICVFCHTPHNASPAYPLWNHEVSAVENYTNYWSASLQSYASQADAPPVDGFSKLCLSCHDGTVALGALINKGEEVEMIVDYLAEGNTGYIGTDLSGGHPVSIIFDASLANKRNSAKDLIHLNWPVRKLGDRESTGDKDVMLYPTQGDYGVQCTSCHDPHGGKGGPGAPPFWRKQTYDEVCLVCHMV